MKKIVVLAFMSLVGITTVRAQGNSNSSAPGDGFSLSDIFVSGTIAFGNSSSGGFDSNQFNFSPQLGYFVDDNFAIGGRLGYTSSTSESPSFIDPTATVEDTATTLSLSFFGRYYFTPSNKFSFFGEIEPGIFNSKRESGQLETKGNGWFINLSPGINYFLSNHFAIEASVGLLGYNTFELDVDNADTQSNFNIGVNLSDINLGLLYRF